MFKNATSFFDGGKSADEKQHQDGGESLTTVLDTEQRSELTLLIANATAVMRKTIEMNFDASASLSPNLNNHATSENETISNAKIDPGTVDVSKYDRERKLKEQQERELSAPKMKELKEASLNFFDNWQIMMMERVGSVVNSKATASSHLENAAPYEPTLHSPSDRKINIESPEAPDPSAESILTSHYPPVPTPLSSIDKATKILILHSVLLLLLSLEHYVAPSRVLLLYLTSSLDLPLSVLTSDEEKVAKGLLEAASHMSGESETQNKADENKQSRRWKVGLASVAGAALIGVTGGLAAPFVAAGIGSVMGGVGLGATAAAGYLGSVAGSSLIVGGLFGAYGGRMTGEMMDAYAREVGDFAFLPVRGRFKDDKDLMNFGTGQETPKPTADRRSLDGKVLEDTEKEAVESPSSRRLRVTIGVTGWLTSKDEVVSPWRVLGTGAEVFALRWELDALLNLGDSMNTMVKSTAWNFAKSELIKRTIFAELMAAMWPIQLLKISRLVDNPFSVAKSRADKAGEVLADAIIHKAQGERPVTLVGYSLGARVIYACLISLAKRHAFGLVESVVLIGAPTPSDTSDWRIIRSVVSSRLVNVFSENDYVLGFLYRTSSIQLGIAGLQKIEGLPGVENVDVSESVSGHLRYRYLMGSILKKIGFEDVVDEEVLREEEALRQMDREEERRKEEGKGEVEGEKAEQVSTEAEGKETDKEVGKMEEEVRGKMEDMKVQG